MAEETPEIDATTEARRIVNQYLSELGWGRQLKTYTIGQVMRPSDRDMELKRGDEMELTADEHFGAEVDRWRAERSKLSKAVLSQILEILGKRTNLSFFAGRILARLKEELK